MKRILLLITIMSSIANLSKAQGITYNDLNFGFSHNIEETKTHLSKIGFSLSSIDTPKNSDQEYLYLFAKNAYESITIRAFNNHIIETDLYTTMQDDYSKINSGIKSAGYKLISTRSAGKGRVILAYKLRESEIDFMATRKTGLEITDYYITLTNTKLRREEISNLKNK